MFDGSTLFVPLMSPHIDLSSLPVLGKILSYGYLCTGFLPTKIYFPSLAAMLLGLLGPGVTIERNVLVESFLDFLSYVDRSILHEAMQISTHCSKDVFPFDIQEQLLTVLSDFGCQEVPTPMSLSQIVTDIARYVFLANPRFIQVFLNIKELSGLQNQLLMYTSCMRHLLQHLLKFCPFLRSLTVLAKLREWCLAFRSGDTLVI